MVYVRADWLVLEVFSKYSAIIFEQPKRQNTLSAIQFPTVFWYIDRKKLIFFWFLCGIYTKTIFHLSVGASSVYYPQFSE